MMRQKRGGIAITTIIELAIVVILALAFANVTIVLTSEQSVLDLYIARDVAKITDSALSSTYDITYTYPQSYERLVFVDGNKIFAVQDDSFFVDGKILAPTVDSYWSSGLFSVMTSVVLDASFFSIHKIGKAIFFVNARLDPDQEEALRESFDVQKQSKEDLLIKISFTPGDASENVVLNELVERLEDDFSQAGFTLSSQATLNVELSFVDEKISTVAYSDFSKTQTKPLAQEILRLLENQIIIQTYPIEKDYETSISTISIDFSNKDITLKRFQELNEEDKGLQSSFSKRVVLAFSNFYGEVSSS